MAEQYCEGVSNGERFQVSDEEIVGHYLYRKVMAGCGPKGLKLSQREASRVPEADLYAEEPWDVWSKFANNGAKSQDLYFYTRLQPRKISNESRFSRRVGSGNGSWHGEDAGLPISVDMVVRRRKSSNGDGGVATRVTALKKRFNYRNPNNLIENGRWILHEYSCTGILGGLHVEGGGGPDLNWVICRLRKSPKGLNPNNNNIDDDIGLPLPYIAHDDDDMSIGGEPAALGLPRYNIGQEFAMPQLPVGVSNNNGNTNNNNMFMASSSSSNTCWGVIRGAARGELEAGGGAAAAGLLFHNKNNNNNNEIVVIPDDDDDVATVEAVANERVEQLVEEGGGDGHEVEDQAKNSFPFLTSYDENYYWSGVADEVGGGSSSNSDPYRQQLMDQLNLSDPSAWV